MPLDKNKNVAAEIRRVAESEGARMVLQMQAAGERFSDKDWVTVYLADALEDAYKRAKNWETR